MLYEVMIVDKIFVVVNKVTHKIQSAWVFHHQALHTARDLNSFALKTIKQLVRSKRASRPVLRRGWESV